MSIRAAFGNNVGDIQIEMSYSPAHYHHLTRTIKKALLDPSEETRNQAQQLTALCIVYDTKYGTSRLRKKTAPLLEVYRHREHITQPIITGDEIYVVLADDEGRTRMAYLCTLEKAVDEGLSVHPFKIDPFQPLAHLHS